MSEFSLWHWLIAGAIFFFVVRPILRGFSAGGRSAQSQKAPTTAARSFDTPVVGESNYQSNLLSICGARGPDGVEKYFKAQLIFEDANPYDPEAVRVDIANLTVGYLSREGARAWRRNNRTTSPHTRSAVVRGGWDRGPGDQGSFGVWLDLR